MPLSAKAKKGIKIGAIVFGVVVLIILAFLLVRKVVGGGGDGGPTIQVIVNLKGPSGPLNHTTSISTSEFKAKTFGPFFFNSIDHLISYSITDVAWASITLSPSDTLPNALGDSADGHCNTSPKDSYKSSASDNIIIPLTDSKIAESAQNETLVTLFKNIIPKNIIIDGVFTHTCSKGNKPKCKESCDGNGPKCTPTGWQCLPGQVCPSTATLETCCQASGSAGAFATCGPHTDFKAICEPCPGTGPTCTGDPCKGVGRLCTSTGWICAEGQHCPEQSVMDKCCTTAGEHATCIDGAVHCSTCSGGVTTCKPDCDMSGLVCGTDGKFVCKKGTTCPTDIATLNKCCTDPKKPVGYCPTGSSNVECRSCDPDKKPDDKHCPETCSGDGWKCTGGPTNHGWTCAPGVKCATGAIAAKCCDGTVNMHPVCDPNSKCTTCVCDEKYTQCATPECSGDGLSQCAKTCCPAGVTCGKDSVSKECLCCGKDQVCNINGNPGCCPGGTVCDHTGTACIAVCGTLSTGEMHSCDPGEKCMVITNITALVACKLKWKYKDKVAIDKHTNTAYVCMSDDGQCSFSNEHSSPFQVLDNYPCFDFPMPDIIDPNNPGIGYCVEDEKHRDDPSKCIDLKDPAKCAKGTNCLWRDPLTWVSGGKGEDGIKTKLTNIQNDIIYLHNTTYGNYCDPTKDKSSFMRVVGYAGSSDCDWQNCWAQIAQPDVIDVEFNSDTKSCIALQACNDNAGTGMNTYTVGKDGKHTKNIPKHIPTTFEDCSDVKKCPVTLGDPNNPNNITCNTSNGELVNYGWYAEGDKGEMHCVQGNVTGKNANDWWRTEDECYSAKCGTCYDSDGHRTDKNCDPDGLCCTNGFKWDLETKKCYQQPAPSGAADCGGSFTECRGVTNSCGDTWRAHCHGGAGHCHANCCSGPKSKNKKGDADGGGPPKNANKPYCICQHNGTTNKYWYNYDKTGYCYNGSEIGHDWNCNPRRDGANCT